MLTEGLLAGILASQWVTAQKAGVKLDDILAAMRDQRFMAYVNQGILPSAVDEGIMSYSRQVIDLTTARDYTEVPITGQWFAVESCTGVDIAAYLNMKNPLPDPVYLDRVNSLTYPCQRMYLKHTAQSGKQLVLLVGRNGLKVEPDNTPRIRWGIPREPTWTHGAENTAPGDLTALVTKTIGTGKTGQLYGFHVSAGEANSFRVSDGTTTLLYHSAGAGPIDIVLPSPLIKDIVAGASITVKNVNAAAAGIVYQASVLTDEA